MAGPVPPKRVSFDRRWNSMADTWLCDFGIRVTDLNRSLEFYSKLLDLVELKRASDGDSAYVLLKDRRSGQRIELNWYAESSPFFVPYVAGESLDHLEVRVRNVPEILVRLRAMGIAPVNRKLWVNSAAVQKFKPDSPETKMLGQDVWTTSTGHRIAYIPDPDGNLICLYDHPEEEWEGPIPDHY
jgi:catechol 2,3-dioxygenase-like lactoylglutathione lyase family enzyme